MFPLEKSQDLESLSDTVHRGHGPKEGLAVFPPRVPKGSQEDQQRRHFWERPALCDLPSLVLIDHLVKSGAGRPWRHRSLLINQDKSDFPLPNLGASCPGSVAACRPWWFLLTRSVIHWSTCPGTLDCPPHVV